MADGSVWTLALLKALRGPLYGVEPHKLYRSDGAVYMERWCLQKNTNGGTYLHHFVGDDDVVPHDHPRRSTSLILAGSYRDCIRNSDGTMLPTVRQAGDVVHRKASTAHRIELIDGQDAWSLFMFGPHVREWGFICPSGRWVPWKQYTAYTETGDSSVAGRGCE